MDLFATMTGPDSVRFRRLLPGPVERVWAYLTESDKRARWLAAGEMDLRVGGAVTLRFRHSELASAPEPGPGNVGCGESHVLAGRITRCDPPQLLSFTWGGEEPASEVTFELTPRGEAVELIVTHRRLKPEEMVEVAAGWHTHLDLLVDVAEGRTAPGFWSTWLRLEAAYRERLGH